jgi:hypothetical protein
VVFYHTYIRRPFDEQSLKFNDSNFSIVIHGTPPGCINCEFFFKDRFEVGPKFACCDQSKHFQFTKIYRRSKFTFLFSEAKVSGSFLMPSRPYLQLVSMKSNIYPLSMILIQLILGIFAISPLNIWLFQGKVVPATGPRCARPTGTFHNWPPNCSRSVVKITVILAGNSLHDHVVYS